eukprot:TRINITY_DN73777_c0_g1_i1.p1 TRINITY_DN73777_c0_g1~~TRINITY_DN73777_c0_g1_i1.p1  ORF type:complete len:521 (-),score=52.60 TRINITY_DN73777_c0_g1_i1:298-1824(-)
MATAIRLCSKPRKLQRSPFSLLCVAVICSHGLWQVSSWYAHKGSVRALASGQALVINQRADSFTDTEETSVFDAISDKFSGACGGLVLFIFGFPVLWANEMRVVRMAQLFLRAESIAKTVNSEKVEKNNEACLVHTRGTAATTETLEDSKFGLRATNSVKLRRHIEMYQWVEKSHTRERDKPGGGKEKITTYTYEKEWSPMACRTEHSTTHVNPKLPLKGTVQQVSSVTLDAFKIPQELISKMTAWQPCTSECKTFTASDVPCLREAGLNGKYIQSGADRGFSPQIGDLRIFFDRVPCGPVTALAVQHNDTFVPMKQWMNVRAGHVASSSTAPDKNLGRSGTDALLDDPEAGDENLTSLSAPSTCCGLLCFCCKCFNRLVHTREEIFEIQEAKRTRGEIFHVVKNKESIVQLLIRFAGYMMLIIGLNLMFSFVPALFRIVPYLGVYVEYFGQYVAYFSAVVIGWLLGAITTTLAWFAARPVKSTLVLLCLGLIAAAPYLIRQYMPLQS